MLLQRQRVLHWQVDVPQSSSGESSAFRKRTREWRIGSSDRMLVVRPVTALQSVGLPGMAADTCSGSVLVAGSETQRAHTGTQHLPSQKQTATDGTHSPVRMLFPALAGCSESGCAGCGRRWRVGSCLLRRRSCRCSDSGVLEASGDAPKKAAHTRAACGGTEHPLTALSDCLSTRWKLGNPLVCRKDRRTGILMVATTGVSSITVYYALY